MGEIVDPKAVTQVDLGSVPIDTSKIVLPTEDVILDIQILRTPDRKWSRFDVRTTQRTLDVCPGTVGTVAFDAICEKCAAMLKTAQGVAFLQSLQVVVAGKPLELKPAVVEAAVVAPK